MAPADPSEIDLDEGAFPGEGTAVNSGPLLDGKPTAEAKQAIVGELARVGRGAAVTNYRLRDWVFSRCVLLCLFLALLCFAWHMRVCVRVPAPGWYGRMVDRLTSPFLPYRWPRQATLLGRAHPHLLPRGHGRPRGRRPPEGRPAHHPVRANSVYIG